MQRCLLSILIWAVSTAAQAPAGIPACAKSAISSGIRGSGCASNDIPCFCASENFNFAIESAVDKCNEDDQETLHDIIEDLCYNEVLEVRSVDEDGAAEDDPSSGTVAAEGTDQATLGTHVGPGTATVASEGTDQATLETPVVASTPTIATEGTDQATLETPVIASTPTIATEGTDQATLGTPVPVPASTPTIATENSNQATLSTPTVIAAPKTPLPTTATSIVTDTREFSNPKSSSHSVVTNEQAADAELNGLTSATTTSPNSKSTALLSANATSNSSTSTGSLLGQDQSSVTGEAPSEVGVSVGALFVAVVGLTWVFAEF
jgi:hypothetical protein